YRKAHELKMHLSSLKSLEIDRGRAARMRKSSSPTFPAYQSRPTLAADHHHNKEEVTNFRGQMNNSTTSTTSSSGTDKKKEEEEAPAVTKKLESKPSQDINQSAEAFIQNFRKQLLIQRLESIENYEKMLERGL
ncbi:DUF761 domain protein, partial [Quillaja saponaria]